MMANIGARALLSVVWLLHWLPLGVQAVLGRGFGRLLHAVGRERRGVALRNLELCMPELSAQQRQALVLEHFKLLGRSLLERGVLWYASADAASSSAVFGKFMGKFMGKGTASGCARTT